MNFIPQSAIRNPQLLFCLALLCLPPALSAQGNRSPYMIYGRVAQPDDTPAVRAVVNITDHTGFDRQVYSDDAGRFEIKDLPRGRYYLTASNPSAPDQYTEAVVVELSATSTFVVATNIFLRAQITKEARPEKKPGVISVGEEKQDAPKTARKAFAQGTKLRAERKYDQALKKFNRAIELHPSYFQALTERGNLLVAMSKLPEAMQDFERALALNSHYGPALSGSGTCKFQLGRYADAIADLERATDAEPGNPTNYYFMGIAEVALDRREQARAALLKALSIDPMSSARAHVHLATLFIRENRPQEAVREIESYFEAVPNPPDKEKLNSILAQLRVAPRPR